MSNFLDYRGWIDGVITHEHLRQTIPMAGGRLVSIGRKTHDSCSYLSFEFGRKSRKNKLI